MILRVECLNARTIGAEALRSCVPYSSYNLKHQNRKKKGRDPALHHL